MAVEQDITGFHKGEVVVITLLAKDPDGTVITSPASQTVSITFGATAAGDPALEFDTDGGQIALSDAGTGEFTITLTKTNLADLSEGVSYFYNIWSWTDTAQRILQKRGRFRLAKSVEAS